MAAKEKKSAIAKQLNKDSQLDKSGEPKARRGRKLNDAALLTDGKSDSKGPASWNKKRKENSQDGRTTPNTRKKRNATELDEESETAKTPPPTMVKVKKAFLERELEDILENATGRNTPSTPRNRKANEKEEESVDSEKLARTRKGGSDESEVIDEKGGFLISKMKGRDVDDDNISVRSLSTLRTRRNADKDDDDVLSVRSMNVKMKKNEVNNEDSASVSSLTRSNTVKKVNQKKKAVPVVKKKIFLKKGRKKGQVDSKAKITKKKKSAKADEIDVKETKKLKPLKYQNLIGSQRRLRSAMLLKKQKLKKAILKTESRTRQKLKYLEEEDESDEEDQIRNDKERLKLDSQNAKSDSSKAEADNAPTHEEPKKSGPGRKKIVKKDKESVAAGKSNTDKMNQRLKQTKMKLAKKLSNDSKKRKRLIHFETTSCPDDSSVILVQPRLGPKKRYSRQSQALMPKSVKKVREILPKGGLPVTSGSNVPNFSQIGSSYFVQSIPNFKLLATNSTVIRSYNTNRPVNPNFDVRKPIGPNNMPYLEENDRALATFDPKMWPNDTIVTPSGIVLSSSRLISTSNHPSNICINGPSGGFAADGTSNKIIYSAQKTVGNVSTTEVFYQNNSNVIQPQTCTKTTTAILLERPESMSTSLISASGTVVIPINTNGGLNAVAEMSRLKGFTASTQTDTIVSEKASEGDAQSKESALERLRNSPNVECLPKIPVAKNVNELLLLKSKFDSCGKKVDKTDEKNSVIQKLGNDQGRQSVLARDDFRRTKRTLRNVRQNHTSVSELTFSEPESSCYETEQTTLYKTISYERLDKACPREESNTNVLLQLGSEPIAISESIAPFETASAFLLDKRDKIDRTIKLDYSEEKSTSPKTKDAIEVCSFSKENAEALRELGLDSDVDQSRSEPNSSPMKMDEDQDIKCDSSEFAKKERIKEEVDNVLKEMPNRKIPNLPRKSECFNLGKNKVEIKNPLVLKNNDYLMKSPPKPPTVIDKLLERNKSLKKAEQESRYQNSVRNLSENLDNYEKNDLKHKRNGREMRLRKFTKGEQRRLVASKRFINTTSGCRVFERRGSNPEIYSSSYVAPENNVSNENVPLIRALEICDNRDKLQRRGSIDFESIQKVMDRRSSLPISSEKLDDIKKLKTENVKTILIRSSTPLTSKNHGGEHQTRVINIITEDDGSKKGQNLMEEIGMEIEKDNLNNSYMNGDKESRRTSVESSTSESDSLKKLMDSITMSKRESTSAKEVPYSGENSLKVEKIRLSIDKKNFIEESPEDLIRKETILSALGLQRVSTRNAQKKDAGAPCQAEGNNYTGTLKTVIKIQRQEKKGNSKAPMKMIYKASSSSSSFSGQTEEPSLDTDSTPKEETEEESKNGNGKAKSLVIPEKASSFSIHPGRMCSDVCTYCFGKFGLLDTPCHIAQLKDAHKRRNILAVETHLLADSCLCDACFRHVDKKSNCQTSSVKKVDKRKFPVKKHICCARNCNSDSQHKIKRKWFMKLKKSIGRKVILDPTKLEKLVPGQLVTLCNRHFYWVDYYMSCGICKKRLTSVNMCKIGPDLAGLNAALSADGIPTILTDKRFLCKICQCYASLIVKFKEPSEMRGGQSQFYEACRKRILRCHEIDVPDSEGEPERDRMIHKNVKKGKKTLKPTATVTNGRSKSDNETEVLMEELDKANDSEKESDMKEVSHMNIPPKANSNLDFGGVSITPSTTEVNPTQIHVKLGNLNIGALGNLNIGQDMRHGSRSGDMQCFPTEAELALRAHFDLQPSAEDESAKTARKGFEKCTTTIQFNPETKNLFYSLQMPYGNHSSFFRHLILLEKYFRSGDLVIARNADPKAVSYISSVQNRIRSYEGIHSPAKKPVNIPPSLSILPQPLKTENRSVPEIQPSVIQSRPFTLTPMPSNAAQGFPKNSPLSHIQATVQNIPTPGSQSQGFVGSLLKSANSKSSHLSPEISITSVPPDPPPPPPPSSTVKIGKNTTQAANALTSKIQENLRNLASKSQNSKGPNQARAVILNRTVGGQKQSLVQVTTGGKTIHLTLYQFKRIQQMQMRKKQYLEHQAKARMKEDPPPQKKKPKQADDGFDVATMSPELEIQEIGSKTNGSGVYPLISEVRSLAGDESGSWEKDGFSDGGEGQGSESFPKIPKALSVSVTKIPSGAAETSVKEQSVDPDE